jgi:hypothetical protein
MRFFRRHPQTVFVALLALCLQWAASFGHVHALRSASPDLALACRTIFKPAAELPCPGTDQSDKDCPICWSMAHAGAAVLPAPPAITLPALAFVPEAPQRASAHVTSIAAASFEARGPPILHLA